MSLVNESRVLELRLGRTVCHKMTASLGMLCMTPPSNSNQCTPNESNGGGGAVGIWCSLHPYKSMLL
jgi:hypothetical protein